MLIHGWQMLAHARFLDQYEQIYKEVERLYDKYPDTYQQKAVVKRFEAIVKLAFDIIPQDPTRASYRQGSTLGKENKHWLRAKFYQQYRLFFRYHAGYKTIVLGWVNDPKTKRAYDSKTDAYRVFQKMLDSGSPPSDWKSLVRNAQSESDRLGRLVDKSFEN